MISRRHIRIKVMQSVYAFRMLGDNDLKAQEAYLIKSIELLHKLYLVQLQLLVALLNKAEIHFERSQKKYLPSDSPLVISPNFFRNRVLHQLKKGEGAQNNSSEKEKGFWKDRKELPYLLWKKIQKSEVFKKYMYLKNPTYEEDKKFMLNIYKELIAPDEKLAEFYESEIISWVDDIPFVNSWVVSNLSKLKALSMFVPDALYKNEEDKEFALQLFHKTLLNFDSYEKDIANKTPNWDSDRITKIDKLLMVMAITEFVHFQFIPTKVSMNEYIEIAKDYATLKSSFFINGVLDKLLEDYNREGRIRKEGRGLL